MDNIGYACLTQRKTGEVIEEVERIGAFLLIKDGKESIQKVLVLPHQAKQVIFQALRDWGIEIAVEGQKPLQSEISDLRARLKLRNRQIRDLRRQLRK